MFGFRSSSFTLPLTTDTTMIAMMATKSSPIRTQIYLSVITLRPIRFKILVALSISSSISAKFASMRSICPVWSCTICAVPVATSVVSAKVCIALSAALAVSSCSFFPYAMALSSLFIISSALTSSSFTAALLELHCRLCSNSLSLLRCSRITGLNFFAASRSLTVCNSISMVLMREFVCLIFLLTCCDALDGAIPLSIFFISSSISFRERLTSRSMFSTSCKAMDMVTAG
mmetsp:Transcript_59684/g.98510  ORF Transcript_59684/g.98510 Transcript_59684/m.98510 type:complete len:231 (-) Transcript_59684:75-767(-)